ncbi:MAG: YraN family protein [Planctomycetota bacterium]
MLALALRLGPTRLLERLARRRRAGGARFPSRTELGRIGEELVARWLAACGWTIVARNLRAPEGELDLVGRDGPTLVVVEVKTGRVYAPPGGTARRPAERVSRTDVQRRRRAAQRIARGGPFRFDVVEVLTDRRVEIVHRADVRGSHSRPAARENR